MPAKKEKEDLGYTVGTWANVANYECNYCGFKITTLPYMTDHVNEHRMRIAWEEANGIPWNAAHNEEEFASTPQAEEGPAPQAEEAS